MENAEILSYPPQELENYIEQSISFYQDEADSAELTLEEYLSQMYDETLESVTEELEGFAKQYVGEILIMNAIAAVENLSLSDEDYQTKGEELALEYGYGSLAEMEETQTKEDIHQVILFQQVQAFLVEAADITESDELLTEHAHPDPCEHDSEDILENEILEELE